MKAALEARLNRPFIARSAARADNRRMPTHRPPAARPVPARALALLIAAALAGPAALAGDDRGSRAKSDHEQARAAVQAGQVMPLSKVLEQLQRTHPGQVLELELERDDGRWVYEVRLLQPDGQLLKIALDAGTAQVLAVKRRGGPASAPAR